MSSEMITSPIWYHGTAFGLSINSELELPELATVGESTPQEADVAIQIGAVDEPETTSDDSFVTRITPSRYHLAFEVVDIEIRDGETIIVDPEPQTSHEVLRHVILGPAINHLLHQRGYFVLHASTVAIDDIAVAFIGDSGQGKTTTAGAFLLDGFPVLSDDVACIVDRDQGPVVKSGFPALKLDESFIDRFDPPVNPPIRTCEQRDRHFHGMQVEQPTEAIPLERVYVLSDGDTENIESLPSGEALTAVAMHTYTAGILEERTEFDDHFDRCSRLIETVDIKQLTRRRQFDRLEAVVDKVTQDIRADG